MRCGRWVLGINGQKYDFYDVDARLAVFLMVFEMPDMPIAFVSLPEKRPAADLVAEWSGVFRELVEVDAVEAQRGKLHVS